MTMDKQEFLGSSGIPVQTLEVWLEQRWLIPAETQAGPAFSDADIAQKVTQNALPFAGQEVTDRIIKCLVTFETFGNVREFTKLLAFDWSAKQKEKAA